MACLHGVQQENAESVSEAAFDVWKDRLVRGGGEEDGAVLGNVQIIGIADANARTQGRLFTDLVCQHHQLACSLFQHHQALCTRKMKCCRQDKQSAFVQSNGIASGAAVLVRAAKADLTCQHCWLACSLL